METRLEHVCEHCNLRIHCQLCLKARLRRLRDEDDCDIRDTAGFDGFDSGSTYDDWRQP